MYDRLNIYKQIFENLKPKFMKKNYFILSFMLACLTLIPLEENTGKTYSLSAQVGDSSAWIPLWTIIVSILIIVDILPIFTQKTEVPSPVRDEDAPECFLNIMDLTKRKYKFLNNFLEKGILKTDGANPLLMKNTDEPGWFKEEEFFRTLVSDGQKELYLLVHKATGDFATIGKNHPGFLFTPNSRQPTKFQKIDWETLEKELNYPWNEYHPNHSY